MSSRRQYLLNIFWSWLGAAALIANGVLVAPYLIRRLGTDQYGVWALGLALVEYFWMIDLGVRPATVKLTAEYCALEKWEDLNSLLSTAALYSGVMGTLVLLTISLSTGWIARFFHITHPSFPILLHVVSISWALGLVFNVFAAALEGFQRFDITNHIFILFLAARSISLVTLVSLGRGLTAMSVALLITQLVMYAAFYVCLRRLYPRLRVSPLLATKAQGREILLYAKQIVSAMLSARLLQSAIPSVIARLLPVRNVTYYSVTQKVLDYAGEAIGRIGLITGPRASDWMARGHRQQIIQLAEYANKYCLTLCLFFSTFFFVYGYSLLRVWISPEFANNATIILRILVVGQVLWLGQFVSGAVLMGIARYGEYSASLMVEAIITVAGFAAVLPFYGLAAGAAVAATMMALNRCVNLCRIFAKEFEIPAIPYAWRIYRMPMALAILDGAGLWALKQTWLPAFTKPQLLLAGCIHGLFFCTAGFFLVVEPQHRALAYEKLEERIYRITGWSFRATKLARGAHGSGGSMKL